MSAKDDLPSKQKGFQLGIDDYMVKPVELDELLWRVRALLRRANVEMERKIIVGNLTMDADAMSAAINGEEQAVTTREFNILYKLLSYPNKTFSRAQLMDEFWGIETDTSLRAVGVYITKLRDAAWSMASDLRYWLCPGGCLFAYVLLPAMEKKYHKIPQSMAVHVAHFLAVTFVLDLLISVFVPNIGAGIAG